MKIYQIPVFLIILILTGMDSCIEPIDPEALIFEELLVVEGLITNEAINHEVKLSRSFELNKDTINPVTGATVWVTRNDGVRYDFPEYRPGVYKSDTFMAVSDFRYQLHIQTASGNIYKSSEEEIKKTSQIKDISARFTPDHGVGEGTFRLYLDTEESPETKYYRWKWEETYKIQVNFPSYIYRDDTTIRVRSDPCELKYCYSFDNSSNILVSGAQDNGQVLNFGLNEFHSTSKKLAHRYSIEARQFGLDETGYRYWKLISSNNQQGGLFDEQPGTFHGNICSENGNDKVLGLFEVSEVSKYRVFFSYEDFVEKGYKRGTGYIFECSSDYDIYVAPTIQDAIEFDLSNSGDWIPYLESQTFPSGYLFTRRRCGDCRTYGVNIAPEYWIE